MDWAIDPVIKKEIHASSPLAFRNRHYICPSCEAPVELRKGERNAPYFAHAHGQAKPYCDRYVPGTYVDRTLMKEMQRQRLYNSLGLYIRLIEENHLESAWHLEIGIPSPERVVGLLRIPSAHGGERLVPLNKIKSGGLRVRVRPESLEHNFTVEGVFEGDWLERIQQNIIGLQDYDVFRYSLNGGRRMAGKLPLFWANIYIIVWHIGKEPSWFPNPDLMLTTRLRKQGQWDGVVIYLPDEYDELVLTWANIWLQREIVHSPVNVTLASPIPDYRMPDGSYIINGQSDITVSLVGESGSKPWTILNVVTSNEERIYRHKGNGEIPYNLSIGRFEPGRVDIWVDEEFDYGLHLIIDKSRRISSIRSPSVTFHGVDKTTRERISVSLNSIEANMFFEQVLTNKMEVVGINCPDHIKLQIKWKLPYEKRWHEEVLSYHEDSGDCSSRLIQLLAGLAEIKGLLFTIVTRNFGQVEINLRGLPEHDEIVMSNNWRIKAKWILANAFSSSPGLMVPMSRYLSGVIMRYYSRTDQLLIKKLSRHQIPIVIVPQLKSLVSECIINQEKLFLER